MAPALKLMALDETDLTVLSACVQDSILKLSDIRFERKRGQFSLCLRRFVWESHRRGFFGLFGRKERRLAILHFNRVAQVKRAGIDPANSDQVLSLLAVTVKPDEKGSGAEISLHFAKDAAIRLIVEEIEAQLADQDAAWQAASTPKHRL